MILVSVLATLLFPAGGHGRYRGNAKRMNAKNQVMNVVAALKYHHVEYGSWPAGNAAQTMKILRGWNERKVVFFEAPVTAFNERGELLDPWKMPYRFGTTDVGFAWAYSCGPNKLDESGAEGSDDIVSWR